MYVAIYRPSHLSTYIERFSIQVLVTADGFKIRDNVRSSRNPTCRDVEVLTFSYRPSTICW